MWALGFNCHSKTSRRPKTIRTGKYQVVNQYEFPILYDMLKFWLLKVQVTRSQGIFLDKNQFNQEKIAKDFLALYDLYRPSISRQGSQVTVKDRSYIFTPLKDLKWKITSCQPVDTLTADTLTAVTAVTADTGTSVTAHPCLLGESVLQLFSLSPKTNLLEIEVLMGLCFYQEKTNY